MKKMKKTKMILRLKYDEIFLIRINEINRSLHGREQNLVFLKICLNHVSILIIQNEITDLKCQLIISQL